MSNWKKLKEELDALKQAKPLASLPSGSEGIKDKIPKRRKRSKSKTGDESSTSKQDTTKAHRHKTKATTTNMNGTSESTSLTEKPSKKPKLWFEGTVSTDTKTPHNSTQPTTDKSILVTGSDTSVTKCIALDCEMVRGGSSYSTQYSMLARCSIVNSHGNVLYNKYVTPRDKVLDYCTKYSGITRKSLKNSTSLDVVQKEVSKLLHNRILVGHALHHDLKVLFLSHPSKDIRDTSKYQPFRFKGHRPSLKDLAKHMLGITIQEGSHDSIEDARVAMKLYQINKNEWEKSLKIREKRCLQKNNDKTTESTKT